MCGNMADVLPKTCSSYKSRRNTDLLDAVALGTIGFCVLHKVWVLQVQRKIFEARPLLQHACDNFSNPQPQIRPYFDLAVCAQAYAQIPDCSGSAQNFSYLKGAQAEVTCFHLIMPYASSFSMSNVRSRPMLTAVANSCTAYQSAFRAF